MAGASLRRAYSRDAGSQSGAGMELQLLLADSYGPVAAGPNNLGVANALA